MEGYFNMEGLLIFSFKCACALQCVENSGFIWKKSFSSSLFSDRIYPHDTEDSILLSHYQCHYFFFSPRDKCLQLPVKFSIFFVTYFYLGRNWKVS